MIMKGLVTLFAILSIIILSTFSYVLMQDVVDPITGRRVEDKQNKIIGIIGYIMCALITTGLYFYLFN